MQLGSPFPSFSASDPNSVESARPEPACPHRPVGAYGTSSGPGPTLFWRLNSDSTCCIDRCSPAPPWSRELSDYHPHPLCYRGRWLGREPGRGDASCKRGHMSSTSVVRGSAPPARPPRRPERRRQGVWCGRVSTVTYTQFCLSSSINIHLPSSIFLNQHPSSIFHPPSGVPQSGYRRPGVVARRPVPPPRLFPRGPHGS